MLKIFFHWTVDFSSEPSFQGVNRLFLLTFNANDSRIGHSRYFLPTAIVEDYNVMNDGRNFFDQPIKNDIKTFIYIYVYIYIYEHIYTQLQQNSTITRHYLFGMSGSKIKTSEKLNSKWSNA